MCVCVRVRARGRACNMHVEAGDKYLVLLFVLSQSLSLNLELTSVARKASQQTPGILLLRPGYSAFCVGALQLWDKSLHVYVTRTLSPKPSP